MRILLAEDDKTLSRGVTALLEHDGYIVDAVADGQDAVAFAERESYDCIILDVMMPGLDGLSVVRKLRQAQNNAPVLFLSAKGSLQDRVAGLDAGADDYLPKPFAGSELRARVRALLRRRTEYTPNRLTFADLTLDTGTCELSCADSRIILSRRAYQVMEAFMRNPRMVISPEQLMERIWGWDSEAEIHVVWVNVSFLRKQLTALGSGPISGRCAGRAIPWRNRYEHTDIPPEVYPDRHVGHDRLSGAAADDDQLGQRLQRRGRAEGHPVNPVGERRTLPGIWFTDGQKTAWSHL